MTWQIDTTNPTNVALNNHYVNELKSFQSSWYMINSFKEYVKKRKEEFINWINNDQNNTDLITLTLNTGSNVQYLYQLTRNEYESAINGQSLSLYKLKQNGLDDNPETFTADEVCSAVEDTLSDMYSQEVFLDYVTSSNDHISTSDFCSRINAVAPGISARVFSLYTTIIDCSNNAYDAIKTFFTSSLLGQTQITNGYITVIDKGNYVGNVWVSAFSQVANEITAVINAVVKAIKTIGDLFTNIINSIKAVSLWLIKKLFGNLATDFEGVNGISHGILDFPLLQCNLTEYTAQDVKFDPYNPVWSGQAYSTIQSKLFAKLYNMSHSNEEIIYNATSVTTDLTHGDGYIGFFINNWLYYVNTGIGSSMIDELLHKVVVSDDSINYFPTTLEIPLIIQNEIVREDVLCPDFIIRLGWSSSGDLVLQLFPAISKEQWLSYSDAFINQEIVSRAYEFCIERALGSWFPYIAENQTPGNYLSNTSYGTDYSKSYVNYLSDLCDINYSYTDYSLIQKDLIWSLLSYVCLMITKETLTVGSWNGQICICYPYDHNYQLGLSGVYLLKPNDYRPYCNNNLTPACVHYQSLQERANEIVNVINITLILSVAAFVAYKLKKFSKNRQIKADIYSGEYDRLTWDYYSADSSEKPAILNNIIKMRRKKNITTRINSILGLNSPLNEQTSLINNSTSLIQQLVGDSGKQKDYTSNFTSIEDLIH